MSDKKCNNCGYWGEFWNFSMNEVWDGCRKHGIFPHGDQPACPDYCPNTEQEVKGDAE